MKRFLTLLMLAIFTIGIATSCGSSRKHKKNPKRHKSMGACGVNVRY